MKLILSDTEVEEAYRRWVVDGLTQQEIADDIHVSINTLTRAFNRLHQDREMRDNALGKL